MHRKHRIATKARIDLRQTTEKERGCARGRDYACVRACCTEAGSILRGFGHAPLSPFDCHRHATVWFTQPRWLVLREYILNHIVHHRAQFGVYLRMQGIAVPAIYNDSAGEKGGVFRTMGRLRSDDE